MAPLQPPPRVSTKQRSSHRNFIFVLCGFGVLVPVGLIVWLSGVGAWILRGGEVGPAVGTPDNIRPPAAPMPEGAFTQAEVDAIKVDNRVSRQQSEDRRLANKADRRETLLKDLSKKDANGIPQLVADAYNMIKDRGRFLGRFSTKLNREQALNPSLDTLKNNIHEDRTVQNVLDLLEFEGFDDNELKTKFLDNDDYF